MKKQRRTHNSEFKREAKPDTRKALLEALSERGYGDEQLDEIGRMIDAERSDIFDVLAYVAFALAPMTRVKRVDTHRARIFDSYDDKLQHFIEFVLAQYVNEGVGELDEDKLPDLLELRRGSSSPSHNTLRAFKMAER